MAKPVFISRSSRLSRHYQEPKLHEVVKIDLATYKKGTIFWTGSKLPDHFLEIGDHLGLDILELGKDITALINAQAVIVHEVDSYTFKRIISIINFAVNYDTPVFWIDKNIAPRQWIFSFKKIFVGDVYAGYFWREVMKWIK